VIIGGFCELGDDGRVFNSCALVDGGGVVAVYRKAHLWGEEPRWFVPGEDPAPVVDTRYGRIGLAICYDLEFPELTRGLALAGAELLALPTNYPLEPPVGPGGQPMLSVVASATAYLSRVFVAVCDRCGTERGLTFQGGSVIAAPDGALLASAPADHGEGLLEAEIALQEAADKRWGKHNDAFADRRPTLYGRHCGAQALAQP
jgi:predicted amidohydrolase